MTCLSLARRRIDRSLLDSGEEVVLSVCKTIPKAAFGASRLLSYGHQFTHAAGHWGSKKWPTGPRASVIENTISDWLLTGHCRCEVSYQSLTDSHLLSAMSVQALLGARLGK